MPNPSELVRQETRSPITVYFVGGTHETYRHRCRYDAKDHETWMHITNPSQFAGRAPRKGDRISMGSLRTFSPLWGRSLCEALELFKERGRKMYGWGLKDADT